MVSQTGQKFASSCRLLMTDFFPSVITLEVIMSLEVNLPFVFILIVLLLRSFFWLFPSVYFYMCFLEVQSFQFLIALFGSPSVIYHDHFSGIKLSEVF